MRNPTRLQARRISVVLISRNEGLELARTVENLSDTLPGDAEIVVVDDGSTDGSPARIKQPRKRVRLFSTTGWGVSRARNWGANKAKGDVIVHGDSHIRTEPFWWRPLVELLDDPRVGAAAPGVATMKGVTAGYGLTFTNHALEVNWFRAKPTKPAAVPILPGCCFATRRDVHVTTGGWDEGLLQRGNIDNEHGVRLWSMGYKLMATGETLVMHKFRKRSPYTVGWPQYMFNRLRLAFVHFNDARLGQVVSALTTYPGFGEALALIAQSDVAQRRKEIHSCRKRDDDWFFARFGPQW